MGHGLLEVGFGMRLWSCLIFTGFLPLNVAETPVTFGRRPWYIVQPRAGDCIYFLFYVISAVFTFFFMVFLPPTGLLLQALPGEEGTLCYELFSAGGGKEFPSLSSSHSFSATYI